MLRFACPFLLFALSAAAQTLYVAPSGSDAGSCTAAAPCREIRRALALAAPGTTVLVADGQYRGFTLSDLHGNAAAPITIRAQGSNAEVLPTTDRGDNRDNILVSLSDYIVIDGLRTFNAPRGGMRIDQSHNVTVRNCTSGNNTTWGIFTNHSNDLLLENNEAYGSRGEHGIYVSNSGDRPVVRGNRLHDNAAAGLHMNGDLSAGGGRGVNGDGIISGALVERNIIYNNGALGAAGINMDGVQHSTIRNNLIYNNHASGITMYRIDGGQGPVGNEVLHNTIDMASNGRWGLLVAETAGVNFARNNIFYTRNTARGGISYGGGTDVANLDSDYNVFGGSTYAVTPNDGTTRYSLARWQAQGHEAQSLTAADTALWVAGDYHLKPGSPALDAGAATGVYADIEGNPRPAGAAPDIGAYEAAAAGCLVAVWPAGAWYDHTGGSGTIAVTSGEGCPWTAASNAGWVTITSGQSGSGNGTVAYTVAANASTTSRSATISIAGFAFAVSQNGAPPPPVAVQNPGFENGLAPWVPSGRASVSLTATANTGGYGLRESGNKSGAVYQDVSGFTANTPYRVTAWVRSAAGTTGRASLTAGSASTAPTVASKTGWEQFSLTFVPGSAEVRIALQWSGGKGSVYWDDVEIVEQ